VARIQFAQTLYVLPVSLFGMSVAAAELPELAREHGGATEALRERAVSAGRRVAFFVVPSFVAFLMLGQVVVAGIYGAGRFSAADVIAVWLILAAYSLGLLASTSTRIYQSAFFALRDTKTPARVATMRVVMAAICGAGLMLQFQPVTIGSLTIPGGLFTDVRVAGSTLGPVGLALGAAAGAWLEWTLLYRSLRKRIGDVGAGSSHLLRMFGAAIIAGAAGYGVKLALGPMHPILVAALVLGTFGVLYLGLARVMGLSEAKVVMDAVMRRVRRR
jgi:putative peptidoglycan lipid II flippase